MYPFHEGGCTPMSHPIPNRLLDVRRTAILVTGMLLFCGITAPPAWAVDSRKIEKMIEDSLPEKEQALSAEKRKQLLDTGKTVYLKFCVHCHGPKGKGDGDATHYLSPLPRDLSSGIFKFHSTQNNALPVDEDLARTIRQGIPGTAMPPWGQVLNDQEIHSLVEYIKTFSGRFGREIPDYRIRVGMELPTDPLSVNQGKELYRQMRCGRCHGKAGERSGPLDASLDDIWGHTSYVYDLRRPELYKAGSSSRALYRTLVAGMDGTPMNAYDYLTEDERWHLVHYLLSKFLPGSAKPTHPREKKLVSVNVPEPLTVDPLNSLWDSVPATVIALQPIRFRKHPIHELKVQSAHNENRIAFRLQWSDPTPEAASTGPAPFLDEAAIQFALKQKTITDSPFFGMGEAQKAVNLWHWKAWERTPAMAPGLPSIEAYLNPFTEASVEELNASGFGSLTLQSLQNQHVSGHGRWVNGRWTVVFVRDLSTYAGTDVDFSQGNPFPLAFGVWDGASKDKNASKVVSFWHLLHLKGK